MKTDPINGLPNEKSLLEERRRIFGRNEIPPAPSKSFLRLAWEALQVSFRRVQYFITKKIGRSDESMAVTAKFKYPVAIVYLSFKYLGCTLAISIKSKLAILYLSFKYPGC